ncbi:uncharacterized protein LOC112269274 [Brachypodium distachyon]|uniref:uncharacterized protein LOC112269274 n=1 Tax=Brachypodium distachyon TaxID=15368 RepID=UPI000D0DBD03|nr:uncharacterized protein LOC112269274 [Brachypodium distachyon]|eukprot:XP_024311449.1 uncharacterized protein LOC112269274 [Brachypodium distachyon]
MRSSPCRPLRHRPPSAPLAPTTVDSITQSLNELNAEFPSVGTPDKHADSTNSPNGRSTHPINDGTPVFDATPTTSANVARDNSRESCGGTPGPIFDETVMRHKKDDTNAGIADEPSPPDCTPVWQDTPSQSVDGTEEVTQAWNAGEQLERYQKEHAARVAKYAEAVRQYYRKFPKMKRDASNAPADHTENVPASTASDDDFEAPSPPTVRNKVRFDVAKRKVSRVSSQESPGAVNVRCIPRIGTSPSSQESPGAVNVRRSPRIATSLVLSLRTQLNMVKKSLGASVAERSTNLMFQMARMTSLMWVVKLMLPRSIVNFIIFVFIAELSYYMNLNFLNIFVVIIIQEGDERRRRLQQQSGW